MSRTHPTAGYDSQQHTVPLVAKSACPDVINRNWYDWLGNSRGFPPRSRKVARDPDGRPFLDLIKTPRSHRRIPKLRCDSQCWLEFRGAFAEVTGADRVDAGYPQRNGVLSPRPVFNHAYKLYALATLPDRYVAAWLSTS